MLATNRPCPSRRVWGVWCGASALASSNLYTDDYMSMRTGGSFFFCRSEDNVVVDCKRVVT